MKFKYKFSVWTDFTNINDHWSVKGVSCVFPFISFAKEIEASGPKNTRYWNLTFDMDNCNGHTSKSDDIRSPILNYYRGKTVLLTGVTGFLGECFVVKLLRYILIRSKKNCLRFTTGCIWRHLWKLSKFFSVDKAIEQSGLRMKPTYWWKTSF